MLTINRDKTIPLTYQKLFIIDSHALLKQLGACSLHSLGAMHLTRLYFLTTTFFFAMDAWSWGAQALITILREVFFFTHIRRYGESAHTFHHPSTCRAARRRRFEQPRHLLLHFYGVHVGYGMDMDLHYDSRLL
jgi:hypothetical protein